MLLLEHKIDLPPFDFVDVDFQSLEKANGLENVDGEFSEHRATQTTIVFMF